MGVFTSPCIREYKSSDLQRLVDLYKKAFAEPPWNETWTDEKVKEGLEFALSQKNPIVLIAENSEFIGFTWGYKILFDKVPFLEGKVSENSSYLSEIAVRSNRRQSGVGTALVNQYLRICKEKGFLETVLRTDITNEASMPLFKKLGFKSLEIYDPKETNRLYFSKVLGEKDG